MTFTPKRKNSAANIDEKIVFQHPWQLAFIQSPFPILTLFIIAAYGPDTVMPHPKLPPLAWARPTLSVAYVPILEDSFHGADQKSKLLKLAGGEGELTVCGGYFWPIFGLGKDRSQDPH